MPAWLTALFSFIEGLYTYVTGKTVDERWTALFQALNDIHDRQLEIEDTLGCNESPAYDVHGNIELLKSALVLHDDKLDDLNTYVTGTPEGLGNLYSLLVQILARVAPGEEPPPPIATTADTDLILAALYYIAAQPIAISMQYDDSAMLAALAAARTSLEGGHTALAGSLVSIESDLTSHDTGVDTALSDIQDTLANLDFSGVSAGAPVWPGAGAVTLSAPVALSDGLRIEQAMDGVLVTITTPPSKTGLINVGGAMFDYREGEIAFEADNGAIEPWQYMGFRNAIFTPKSLKQASAVRFRVLAGAEGVVQCWTIT